VFLVVSRNIITKIKNSGVPPKSGAFGRSAFVSASPCFRVSDMPYTTPLTGGFVWSARARCLYIINRRQDEQHLTPSQYGHVADRDATGFGTETDTTKPTRPSPYTTHNHHILYHIHSALRLVGIFANPTCRCPGRPGQGEGVSWPPTVWSWGQKLHMTFVKKIIFVLCLITTAFIICIYRFLPATTILH